MRYSIVLTLLLIGCGGGSSYSGAGADEVPLKSNMREAIENVNARGPGWLNGVDSIKAADRAPPKGVNVATVSCGPPHEITLYRTSFGLSVRALEGLLVHEAFEAQRGCKDNDEAASAFSRCYHTGKTYTQCVEKNERNPN